MKKRKHFTYEIVKVGFYDEPAKPPFDVEKGTALIRIQHRLSVFETVISIFDANIKDDGSLEFSDFDISNALDSKLHNSVEIVLRTALKEKLIFDGEYEVRHVVDAQAISEWRNCRVYQIGTDNSLDMHDMWVETVTKLALCIDDGGLFSREWYILKIIETYFETNPLHPMNGYSIGMLFERMNWKLEHESSTLKKYQHNNHLKNISANAKPSTQELIELRREPILKIGQEIIANSTAKKWNGKSLAYEMLKWMRENPNFEGSEHFRGRGNQFLSEKKLAEMISKTGFWD